MSVSEKEKSAGMGIRTLIDDSIAQQRHFQRVFAVEEGLLVAMSSQTEDVITETWWLR
jgi:hypothetical protein